MDCKLQRKLTHVGGNDVPGSLKVSATVRGLFSAQALAVGAFSLAILLPASARAQQQAPAPAPTQAKATPQVPTISAVSLKRGNSISRSQSGRRDGNANITESTKASSRSAAVKVSLRSFSKPVEPYEVQCFFVAKDSARKRAVFDAKKALSSEVVDEISFFSTELDGGKETKTTTTRRTPVYPGDTDGPYRQDEEIRPRSAVISGAGSKLEGWIVRVVSVGKVVRIEASLPELKRFAEQESAMLEGYAFSTPVMRR